MPVGWIKKISAVRIARAHADANWIFTGRAKTRQAQEPRSADLVPCRAFREEISYGRRGTLISKPSGSRFEQRKGTRVMTCGHTVKNHTDSKAGPINNAGSGIAYRSSRVPCQEEPVVSTEAPPQKSTTPGNYDICTSCDPVPQLFGVRPTRRPRRLNIVLRLLS